MFYTLMHISRNHSMKGFSNIRTATIKLLFCLFVFYQFVKKRPKLCQCSGLFEGVKKDVFTKASYFPLRRFFTTTVCKRIFLHIDLFLRTFLVRTKVNTHRLSQTDWLNSLVISEIKKCLHLQLNQKKNSFTSVCLC